MEPGKVKTACVARVGTESVQENGSDTPSIMVVHA